MRSSSEGRGFLLGAAGGLGLAVLLVLLVALAPQFNRAPGVTFETVGAGPAAETTTMSSSGGCVACETSSAAVAQSAGATSPSATSPAFSSAASNAGSNQALTSIGNGQVNQGAQARPGSLLSSLPSEGAAGLVATLSPVLVGLVVAALIYGAYARRQDSSS